MIHKVASCNKLHCYNMIILTILLTPYPIHFLLTKNINWIKRYTELPPILLK